MIALRLILVGALAVLVSGCGPKSPNEAALAPVRKNARTLEVTVTANLRSTPASVTFVAFPDALHTLHGGNAAARWPEHITAKRDIYAVLDVIRDTRLEEGTIRDGETVNVNLTYVAKGRPGVQRVALHTSDAKSSVALLDALASIDVENDALARDLDRLASEAKAGRWWGAHRVPEE